jgi:hypothetical protein
MKHFDNTSVARTPAKKTGLDSEQRTLLEQTLKKQGLDPTNLSPINQDMLRGRPSGIQQRSTKSTKKNTKPSYKKRKSKKKEQ